MCEILFFHAEAQFMEIYVVYGSMSFEMARWNREQKAKVVQFYLKFGSPVTAQRQFRAFFGARETPDRRTIIRLAESFIAQGSVEERGRAGRARTALTPEKINEIADRVKEKPSISVRRLASESKISYSSTRRILKKKLKLRAYKMPVIQLISPEARKKRMAFARWFTDRCADDFRFLHNLWWSDEAHFYLHGSTNRQNVRVWSDKPPKEAVEAPLHSPKVTVWCAMGAQGAIGPIFVENERGEAITVTQEKYQEVLVIFERELKGRCGPRQMENQWLQQDGAPPHTARSSLEWLGEHFPGRVVGKGADVTWPPSSPDLTPLDFYLWGFVKEKVAQSSPKTVEELKRAIETVVHQIPADTCRRVAEEAKRRAERCISKNGGQVEIA